MKYFVNGSQVTAFSTANYPSLNKDERINSAAQHEIGRFPRTADCMDGYLAETYFIGGQALAPSDFGEFKYNIWIPKDYSTPVAGNNCKLDFEAAADLGNDVSGNNNDWTSSGLTTADQVIDSPTNNHPTLNVLHELATATLANGNLDCSGAENEYATIIIPSSGKWGWKITASENGPFGLEDIDGNEEVAADVSGEVVEMLVDMDAGTLKKKVDGGSLETIQATLSIGAEWYPHFKAACSVDFGQLGYAPTESGYKTLCSDNLDDPVVEESSDGIVVETDTGANIAATLAAARSGWPAYIDIFKNLDADESWDIIFSDDSGISIHFDTDAAKGTKQSLVSGNNYLGASLRVGATYGCYTAEISHTNGSETNQAHSLGSADVAIAKLSNIAGEWWMRHPKLTVNYNILLNSTAAETATEYVEVDNTNVTIKSAAPTGTYRVIVFKEIEGFSKFGAFNGNAAADGPFAHSGLRSALGLVKDADGVVNWLFFNKERLGYNVDNNELHPNTNDIEGTTDMVDLVSNGKKIRTTNAEINTTAHNYIFLDWAEQPGKWANAR